MKKWLERSDISNVCSDYVKHKLIGAQAEGVQARLNGVEVSDTPYGDSSMTDAWVGGWMDAIWLLRTLRGRMDRKEKMVKVELDLSDNAIEFLDMLKDKLNLETRTDAIKLCLKTLNNECAKQNISPEDLIKYIEQNPVKGGD